MGFRGRNSHLFEGKRLKDSLLSTLTWHGKNGVEETVDNLFFFVRYVNDFRAKTAKSISTPMRQLKIGHWLVHMMYSGFDVEVRSLLIQKLVLHNDVTGDQSDLEKAVVAMSLYLQWGTKNGYYLKTYNEWISNKDFISSFDIPHPKARDPDKNFSETDIENLIHLWSMTSSESVITSFSKLIAWMSQFREYYEPLLSSKVFVKSCLDVNRYWILQLQELSTDFRIRVLENMIHEVPDFLSSIINSASYLMNCWRLLNTKDMTVEMLWVEKCLKKLIRVLQNRSDVWKDGELIVMQTARYFRCVTFAIIKNPAATKNLASHAFCWLLNYRWDFSSKHKLNSSGLEGIISKPKLQPLTRDDANMFEMPEHVKDALKSLPDDDLLLDPEDCYYSNLQKNRYRILDHEWTKEMLETKFGNR